MVAAKGEKICSNLEQGVLNWFQRREPEGCQKTECGGLGEVSCNRGDCYCRGWLQLTEDHEGSSTEGMQWLELLRTRRSI